MKHRRIASLSFLALVSNGGAEALNKYTTCTTHLLDEISEASAVTYNRDSGTLFAIGDEGQAIFEYSKSGALLSSMAISNPNNANGVKALVDPEGLTYLGNGKFMIGDERPMTGLTVNYAAGTTVVAADLPVHLFDADYAGNSNTGLEGVCFDPVNNSAWGVKEHSPFAIYQMKDIGLPTQNVTKPFNAREFNKLGYLTDIADIFVMANSNYFAANDPRRMNLLILSQENNLILEMTRTGQVVDQLNISFIGRHTIEGITMDDAGTIFLVSEQPGAVERPGLHVLTTQPASPYAGWASASGLSGENAAPDADADLDGRSNLAEYSFGGNPSQSDNNSAIPTLESTPEGIAWSYLRRDGDANLQYIHKRSTDFVEWTTFTPENPVITPDPAQPGFSKVTILRTEGDREFFKVEVTGYTAP